MVIVKLLFLTGIFCISTYFGMSVSKKYGTRLKELKEIQRALHIFEEKIKFTYEPIPDVFEDISKKSIKNIGNIFLEASKSMKYISAGEAWEQALDNSNTQMNKDDLEILSGLAKMLGKTDLDGQVSEIRLTQKFIDTKIEEAQIEKCKNEKLFKTLGITAGLTMVIILI
ncbi:MAG: stage III sporulation protein AB [Clostridia bacterium]|nr:stage III sporulation protein AB [Clostridia bacterium]